MSFSATVPTVKFTLLPLQVPKYPIPHLYPVVVSRGWLSYYRANLNHVSLRNCHSSLLWFTTRFLTDRHFCADYFILFFVVVFIPDFMKSLVLFSKCTKDSRPQITHSWLSPITSGRFAALTRCHELSACLVLGTPRLSSWWTATSIWSNVIFVT